MNKFVIASHGELAAGIQSTLELFVGSGFDITYMCAYSENYPDIDLQIAEFFSHLDGSDRVVVFTDIYGGSVNQKMVSKSVDYDNVFVIAGFNLPLIVEVVLQPELIDLETLQNVIDTSQANMKLSNIKEPILSSFTQEIDSKKEESVEIYDGRGVLPTTIRVDERLIHGQIAMVWSKELKLHGIIVANDEAAQNETQQMALKMAVPSGIKVLIRTVEDVSKILKDPRSQTRRLLILVRTVEDALRLIKHTPHVEMVNIGNVGKSVDGEKKTFSRFVMLTDKEMDALKDLIEVYPDTALQNLPSDKKIFAKDLIS